jgi:hypothetical protein
MASGTATYVYCLVAAGNRPRTSRTRRGLEGAGPVRLIEVDERASSTPTRRRTTGKGERLYLAVADVPLARYDEAAIADGLRDLEWVSRAAVAHESIVESFIGAHAVLPMKLFTIFASDERAVSHVRAERSRIEATVKRVAGHDEWGVRMTLDRERAAARGQESRAAGRVSRSPSSGVAYLAQKKAQRDAAAQMSVHARDAAADLFDRLAARAKSARRRPASELPVQGGPLLLDAAFLVSRTRSASFKALAEREARALSREGVRVTLTGPWPPYTFVQE